MAAKIIYIAAVVLECIFVPLFLKYSWPKKCWTSFSLKMVCSALFITTGICSIVMSGNHSQYAKLMMIGLVLGMLGDLFLHLITDSKIVFGLGLFSFLIGHIFFILAFSRALNHYTPGAKVFDFRAIIVIVVLVAAFAFYAIKTKMKLGVATIPVALYAVTICTMLVTAWQLSFRFFYEGFDHDIGVIFTVALGSLLFVMSDATLAVFMFGGQDKNRPLKIFNILTYFAGQILLGTSMLYLAA